MATSSITDVIIVDSEKLQEAMDKLERRDRSKDLIPVNSLEQLEAGRKLL
ncbi:MAG: hypothetical protein LBU81_07840 [Methanosarcinales archaeon]|jgi:ACT domain-containing protein|nr:hypothetical protein [Methanosarcinales archaeon]